jgi:hypothetical protein
MQGMHPTHTRLPPAAQADPAAQLSSHHRPLVAHVVLQTRMQLPMQAKRTQRALLSSQPGRVSGFGGLGPPPVLHNAAAAPFWSGGRATLLHHAHRQQHQGTLHTAGPSKVTPTVVMSVPPAPTNPARCGTCTLPLPGQSVRTAYTAGCANV